MVQPILPLQRSKILPNRQNARDRTRAEENYTVNQEAKKEIEALQLHLNKIELEKLDQIIILLKELKK